MGGQDIVEFALACRVSPPIVLELDVDFRDDASWLTGSCCSDAKVRLGQLADVVLIYICR